MSQPISATAPVPHVGWWERVKVDPRYLIAGLITLVLLVAQFRYQVVGGYDRLALALATCVLTEAILSWIDRGRVVNLQSAYISGISLTLLLKPQGGALWPFVLAGYLAIASKYVVRYRENHLWNPTNFAIVLMLLAAPTRVSVLSHQWGNDLATNLVIWCFGLVIAARVRVLHITLTYVASFLALNALRATFLGQPISPELAPLTGPMYQLFVFFMITDPRTVVRGRGPQVAVTILIAVVESLLRLASDRGMLLPIAFNAAPALAALWIVGPIAKFVDLRRGVSAARTTEGPPSPAATAAQLSSARESAPAEHAGR